MHLFVELFLLMVFLWHHDCGRSGHAPMCARVYAHIRTCKQISLAALLGIGDQGIRPNQDAHRNACSAITNVGLSSCKDAPVTMAALACATAFYATSSKLGV